MITPVPVGKPGNVPLVFQRVAIVGLGLIGGSLALAIRRTWPDSLVIGVDRKPVVEQAMVMHAIDVGADDLGMTGDADLIVLAAPVLANDRILREELTRFVDRPAVVTDIGSVKLSTMTAAANLPAHLRFVGGHPLAGGSRGGLSHARPDLFRARPWVLCPSEGSDLYRVDEFVAALGATVNLMDATAHDRLVAFLSELPQLTGSALMAVVGDAIGPTGLALSGNGLRDTTRLAESPSDIWKDIAASNAQNLAPALDALIKVLEELRSDLNVGDALRRVFDTAQKWRATLDRS